MGEGIELPQGGLIGPVLYFRGLADGRLALSALLAVRAGEAPPVVSANGNIVALHLAASEAGWELYTAAFSVPARRDAGYRVGDTHIPVMADFDGDLRLAYVSCNGQENGDLDRPAEDRNAMWDRLARDHDDAPFQLIVHGGDQIYADEATESHPLSAGWPTDHAETLRDDQRAELRAALRRDFFTRYLALYAQPAFAHLAARVPSLAMWDDHDICDGWGSLKPRAQASDVAPVLFDVARAAYLLFQCGTAPDQVPPLCHDRSGATLGFRVDLPDLAIVVPDLRSERTTARVMGDAGWKATEAMMTAEAPDRVLVMSSTPALGPRLSLVERWMQRTPWLEKYEDDLRDQWQSHAHREEWQRFLRAMIGLTDAGSTVTVLSGEIHLATRGTMATGHAPMHQLVASGIAHPAPPGAYPAVLGWLAKLGEAPLKGHPIRLHPLPGKRSIYVAERNYLTLERQAGAWRARWHLEDSGTTPPLSI